MPITENQGRISRRQVLGLGAAALIDPKGLVRSLISSPRETLQPPEVERWTPERAGMNLHFLNGNRENSTEEDVAMFKADVSALAQAGIKNIRFDIPPWILMQRGDTPGSTTWKKESGLNHVKEALQYAKENGVKVQVMMGLPDIPETWSDEDVITMASIQFGHVSSELAGLVDVYQIGNEFNTHGVRRYNDSMKESDIPRYRANTALAARVINAGNTAIKANDAHALTAVNMSYWVGDGNNFDERFLDFALSLDKDSYDLFVIDYYPDKDLADIGSLADYIKFVRKETGKQMYIGEFGLPTFGDFTEGDQRDILNAVINELKKADVQVAVAYAYAWRDKQKKPDSTDSSEWHFGMKRVDGTSKAGWDPIRENLTTKSDHIYEQLSVSE